MFNCLINGRLEMLGGGLARMYKPQLRFTARVSPFAVAPYLPHASVLAGHTPGRLGEGVRSWDYI
jgi:hypothetical protein